MSLFCSDFVIPLRIEIKSIALLNYSILLCDSLLNMPIQEIIVNEFDYSRFGYCHSVDEGSWLHSTEMIMATHAQTDSLKLCGS